MSEPQKEIKKHSQLFPYTDYYSEWKPYLLKVLKTSRLSKTTQSPLRSMAFQLSILKTLIESEQTLDKQIKEHGMNKSDSYFVYNQRLRQIFKAIADGFAWRLLGFNRPLLRILSQNRAPGYIKTPISREDDVATFFASQGSHVLMHDITNILRIGDLTYIDNDGYPTVVEVKKSGKQILDAEEYKRRVFKGGDLSAQAKRIVEVDDAIKSGSIYLGESKANLTLLDVPINTYLNEVEEIITIANKQGHCERFIDKLLYVRAYRLDRKVFRPLPFKQWDNLHFFKSKYCLLENDGEVFRNKIPYSAFPFSDEMILQLLSGEVLLESYLNINMLKRWFEKNGWKVKNNRAKILVSEQVNLIKSHMYKGDKLFGIEADTSLFTLSKDGFNMTVPIENLGFISSDFLKPSIFIEMATRLMAMTRQERSDARVGIGFLNEKKIWI